jgi:hypothetical protein
MSAPAPDGRFAFAAIRPLIAMARADGRNLVAVFRCPVTGRSEKALWRSPPVGASAVTAQLTASSSLYAARNQVNGLVRGLLGYGMLGRMARKASDVVLTGEHPAAQLSVDEEEQGIVGAFRSVADRFTWDGRRWTHAGERAGALAARLTDGPELTPYDRDVTARMVLAVAQVHGGISDDERTHLLDIFGDVGSLEALMARPPLTDAELAETTRGAVRRAMLAATWSMALCDAHFEPAEEALMERFADALGIDVEERVALKREAQVHVVEQFVDRMFAWGGHDAAARAELKGLAERIGMTPGQLERAEARALKKRLS